MKNSKIILILSPLILVSSLIASSAELFPLREIKLNDRAEKIYANYPKAGPVFERPKTNASGEVIEALYWIEFEDNKYWESGMIVVYGGEIVTMGYSGLGVIDDEKAKDTIPLILKALFTALGRDFDFAVFKQNSIREGIVDTPILIWEGDNCFYTFEFTPPDKHVKGDTFHSLLRITSNEKKPWVEDFLANKDIDRDNYSTWEIFYKLNRDKKAIEKLKKECEAYFSSLEE